MTPIAEPAGELSALGRALNGVEPPCRLDPDSWYDGDPEDAIRACTELCHAREQCLNLARANGERFGVWGGTSFDPKHTSKAATP